MKRPATLVIGAGISGLLVARALQASGVPVAVLEKSRGIGGRMATKRVADAVFDHGAQFFTARTDAFERHVETWRLAGHVLPWPHSPHRRMVGRPTMTAVPKALATGLDVRREHKVTAARRRADGSWELAIEDHDSVCAQRLLLACPVPQALALLHAGAVKLPEEVRVSLAALTYRPCLALLVVLAGPSDVRGDGEAPTEGPVRWLADNVKKGLTQSVPAAVTIHATPDFSVRYFDASETQIAAQLLPAVASRLRAPVVSVTLHRWRFSEPAATHADRCVWLPELDLGFAGDAFGGPKVEGAALSGLALGAALQRHFGT